MTQISPHDVVPALRHHLVFSDSPQGLGDGLLSVTNVNNGEEVRLRGFEYSLARMLDGRRTAQEVVAAAERLGLPLTLEGLEGFVNKLASFDLVGADPHPPLRPEEDPSPFNPRARWDEPTREKFRQALREGRTGHLDEAAQALDDLLARSPQTVEALRLRQRVEERQQSLSSPAVSFPEVFHDTERHWLDSAHEVDLTPGWIHGRGVVIFVILVTLGAGLALGATIVPIPHRVRAPAILLPVSSTRVMASRGGTIVNVPVIVGQQVKAGDILFGYDVSATLAALDLAVVRVQRQRQALAGVTEPAPADDAQARHQRAQAEVTRAEQQLTRARVAAGDPFSEDVLAEEEAFSDALDELQHAQVALEARGPQQQLATLRRLEAEVAQLERELEDSVVRAPQAGRVMALEVHPGDSVSRGAEALRLDDSRQIRVIATIDGAAEAGIEAGQPVELTGQGQITQATVKRVEGPYVEMVVDNAGSVLQPGIGRVEIQARPRPLVRLR